MIPLPKIRLTFVTVLAIASFTSNLAPGSTQTSSQVIADLRLANMPPPPGTGSPDDNQKTPGGTRRTELIGACKQTDKPLTALVPIKTDESLTTVEHPVFWFYLPYVLEDIHSIEFSLHNWDDKTLYRTSVPRPKTPGVIGIPLPPSSKYSLKVNQTYHWFFKVNCGSKETPENEIVLDGFVRQVQRSSSLDGVIWYDELTNRAKRYLSEPQNPEVKKDWTELLKAVGLEGLAQEPLVSSVSNSKKD